MKSVLHNPAQISTNRVPNKQNVVGLKWLSLFETEGMPFFPQFQMANFSFIESGINVPD